MLIEDQWSRRQFLATLGSGAVTVALSGFSRAVAVDTLSERTSRPLRIGVIADIHHGLMQDAELRLEKFLIECSKRPLDFILQVGDFCHPKPASCEFVKTWEQYEGERFHVLGNHDMDFGSKEQIMDLWGMKKKYYSFDRGAFHFVVLDCNYMVVSDRFVDFKNGNYSDQQKERRDLVNPEQIEWLRDDLSKTDLQTIVFSHQGLDEVWNGCTVPNRLAIRNAFKEANENAGFQKVVACFCGHHHINQRLVIEDIYYIQINSASYAWVGENWGRMARYKDPLFAFLTVYPAGLIMVEGRQSEFVPPTPREIGYPEADCITAGINDCRLWFAAKNSPAARPMRGGALR